MRHRSIFLAVVIGFMAATHAAIAKAGELGEHGFVKNDDVKIHYVTAGEGP